MFLEIAQQFFKPLVVDEEEEEALGAEDASTFGHRRPVTEHES